MSYRELIPQSTAAFLNLRHLPARLDVEQTAALLGHHPDHIPVLVEGKLLKPLGSPTKNGIKWFACCEVMDRARDPEWLDRAAKQVARYWQRKNGTRKESAPVPPHLNQVA
jgi:hypothetical protein